MSAETDFLARLRQAHGITSAPTTPARIGRYISEQTTLNELSEKTGITDLGLLQELFFSRGRVNSLRLGAFLTEIKILKTNCSEEDFQEWLIALDAKCVREDGTIDKKRLRRNRKE